LEKLLTGEHVPGIENDPLFSAETDTVTDYNMIPGYNSKKNSNIEEIKINNDPDRYKKDARVNSAMEKFRQKKKELDEMKKKRADGVSEIVFVKPTKEIWPDLDMNEDVQPQDA
jgi:hypothetical protein